ncbi:MAG TPA: hypothetical protein VLE95_03835 [Chlamydiales bacterium]|nr:hypothetical protein [Chlamydiales bacterium]
MHVPVTIGSLALNKTSAEVSEFWVGNFPRSLSSTSFTAQSLQIHAGLQQIFSNPVVIDEIDIDNIFVGIEFYNAEGTDSNWTRILNEKEPKKKSSRDYLIRTLMLRNLTVEVRQADGSIKTYPTIQQMEFHNISKDTGFPVDEIEKAIFDLMMKNLFKNLPIDKLFKVLKPLPLPFLGTDS